MIARGPIVPYVSLHDAAHPLVLVGVVVHVDHHRLRIEIAGEGAIEMACDQYRVRVHTYVTLCTCITIMYTRGSMGRDIYHGA